MVSSELPSYRAELVRLIHGDTSPAGPGVKETRVPSAIEGVYPGRTQRYPMGSAVVVAARPTLRLASLTLAAWIWPTTPGRGAQAILGRWSEPRQAGFALALDEQGALALWLGRGDGAAQRRSSGVALQPRRWYFVAASYDAASGLARLLQRAHPGWPLDETSATLEHALPAAALGDAAAPLVIAAAWDGEERGRPRLTRHYNGKIEAPCLFGAALDHAALARLAEGAAPADVGAPLVAAWDFALDTPSAAIRDVGPHGLHGVALQMPARAMTGHAYRGLETDWRRAPAEY